MKKLSELPQYCYLEHDNEIVTKRYILSRIVAGKPVTQVKTVTEEYIQDVLDQVSKSDGTEESEYVSAPNHGEMVEIDMTKEDAQKEIDQYVY